MKNCLYKPIFRIISEVLGEMDIEGYVIGGYVRDAILKRETAGKDIDIVVVGNGIDVAKRVAGRIGPRVKVAVYSNYGTASFRYRSSMIEFVGARKESYHPDSRNPEVIAGSLEDDQLRRDFTINALALSLNPSTFGEFLDPFNGVSDLENGIIRTPNDPARTFSDDPLRMIRAIRFATQLSFSIDALTFSSISGNASRITIVSPERISGELNKIMLADRPSIGLRLLLDSGLLTYILPELEAMKGVEVKEKHGHKDNFDHTMQVLDNVSSKSADLWLRWAALLHDIAKPVTKRYSEGAGWTFHGHEFIGAKMVPSIFRKLRLPANDRMKFVSKLVLLHLRPISLSDESVTDSAVRRLLFEAGDDIDALMLLCEADITSKNEAKVQRHLQNFALVREKLREIEERDHIRNFQPPVTGDEIISTFGIAPGREVGIIKDGIKEAILEGEIPNEREAALRLMHKLAAGLGLTSPDTAT